MASTPVALALGAGLASLAVSVGISRFAYTPILPVMQADLGMSHAAAGGLASANYLGYLVGALAGGFVPRGATGDRVFRLALLVVAVGTLAMALRLGLVTWGAVRLAAGIASGIVFVMAADRVMRVLAAHGREAWLGVHFAGVGVGIMLSALLSPPLADAGGWQAQWLGLGFVSVVLGCVPFMLLGERRVPHARPRAPGAAGVERVAAPALLLLLVAYTLDGFGYIISGTFLVSIIEREGGLALGSVVWALVGLGGVLACVAAGPVARRIGHVNALLVAHGVQVVAVLTPVFTTASALLGLAALLFGGTFMAITTLAVALGRLITPSHAARTTGLLTCGYGMGQIAGPLVAGPLADRSGSFDTSLWLAAAALAVACALLLPRR